MIGRHAGRRVEDTLRRQRARVDVQGRPDHREAARQRTRECGRERTVPRRGHGNHEVRQGSGAPRGLLGPFDQRRADRQQRPGMLQHDLLKRLLGKPHQQGIADRIGRRVAPVASDQGHLPHAIAAPQFGDGLLRTRDWVGCHHAQPPGHHQIPAIAHVTLPKQRLTARQLDPCELLFDLRPHLRLQRSEDRREHERQLGGVKPAVDDGRGGQRLCRCGR